MSPFEEPPLPPLRVFTFCSRDTVVAGRHCTDSKGAFWEGRKSTDPPEVNRRPFLGIGTVASRLSLNRDHPQNREYHEFGHAIMADTLGAMPVVPDLIKKSHGGLYLNDSSNAAWTEGWATFFAVLVTRSVGRESQWWMYPVDQDRLSLENNYKIWSNRGVFEEYALAGVLLDLIDGDADYRASHDVRDIAVLGTRVVDNAGAPKGVPSRYVAVGVRNGGSKAASSVTVLADLEGSAGEFEALAVVEPENLEPGDVGVAIIPLEEGVSFKRARAAGLVAGDDDLVTLPFIDVFNAIFGSGKVATVAEAYEELKDLTPGDTDGNGIDDIDEIFKAHGYYADTAGGKSNREWDPGEQFGLSSYILNGKSVDPRHSAPPIEITQAALDAGVPGAKAFVQIIYDQPFVGRSYGYTIEPDEEGKIAVTVPPSGIPATVVVSVSAEGHLPVVVDVLRTDAFWAAAEANDFQPFLSYEAELQSGSLADVLNRNPPLTELADTPTPQPTPTSAPPGGNGCSAPAEGVKTGDGGWLLLGLGLMGLALAGRRKRMT